MAGLPTLASVRALLHALLPQVTASPAAPAALAQLPLLCSGLQHHGAALEADSSAQLDRLQAALVQLCSDTGLDIQLRLQLLEVLELRSHGWRRQPGMADFYTQRTQAASSQARSTAQVGRR